MPQACLMDPRWNRICGLLIALALCGCGRTAEESATPARPDLSTLIRSAPISQPLTAGEIKAFLLVMRDLPRFEAPLMADLDLPVTDLSAGIDQMRARLRGTLQEDVLAERWLSDPRVRRTLKEFHVEPKCFASLTLRVSASWSAGIVSQGAKLSVVRRHVEMELSRILRELHSNSQVLSTLDQRELTEGAANCVALIEFLSLLEQTPPENLDIVAQVQQELRNVLPRDSGMNSFVRQLDSKAEVLHTGWSSQQ